MNYIYSKIEPSLLLAVIHRVEDFNKERVDIINETEYLQLSSMILEKGKTFRPHKHIMRDSREFIAQEAWLVYRGKIEVMYYDIDDKPFHTEIIHAGDVNITLHGGHTLTVLEEDTYMLEFKPGPYNGVTEDKTFID